MFTLVNTNTTEVVEQNTLEGLFQNITQITVSNYIPWLHWVAGNDSGRNGMKNELWTIFKKFHLLPPFHSLHHVFDITPSKEDKMLLFLSSSVYSQISL